MRYGCDRFEAKQYAGWPITIDQQDNFGKRPTAYLSEIIVEGATDPVVQVVEDSSGEVLYTLRIEGSRFRPWVFVRGLYTVHVGEGEKRKTLRGLPAAARGGREAITIEHDDVSQFTSRRELAASEERGL